MFPPRKQADDETDAKSGPECAAVVPPHSCKCLACHQRCICGRAGMRRIWGPAAGPHIWLWPLAGQLGPYNLGSHSSLWPGERIDTQTHADTHIHQRQQQQHPTSTTWTKHGMWSLHHVTLSKSCSDQRRWGSRGEAQEGLHMHTCSLHRSCWPSVAWHVCETERGGGDSMHGERAYTAFLPHPSP